MKKNKPYIPKVGDKVTVIRVIHVWGGQGNPQDISFDSIKKITDGKITLKSGLVFNSMGFKLKNRDTFIKEIRYVRTTT